MKYSYISTILSALLLFQVIPATHTAEKNRWIFPVAGTLTGIAIGGLIDHYLTKQNNENNRETSTTQRATVITGLGLFGGFVSYFLFGRSLNTPRDAEQDFQLSHVDTPTTETTPIPVAPKNIKFSGASVLPLMEKNENGQQAQYVILTREKYGPHRGTYDAFGGKSDRGESPIDTAAREFYEESIARRTMKMNLSKIKRRLQSHDVKDIIEFKQARYDCRHFTYLINLSEAEIDQFKQNFYPAYNQETAVKYKEKDAIATARWSDLKDAVQRSIGNSSIGVQVLAVLVDPATGHNKCDSQGNLVYEWITVRPPLVKSLQLICNS